MPREAIGAAKTTTAACGIAELRAFLARGWWLRRTIEDRRLGRRGRFAGQAVFAPDGADLRYREEGRLRLGGFETAATRSYRYAFPSPRLAEVRFADGRPFHRLDLSEGTWQVTRRCGDDLYRGAFRVVGVGRWTVAWRVTGPQKDLLLESVYQRPS